MRKVIAASIGGGMAVVIIVAVIIQYYALINLQKVQFIPRSVGNFDAEAFTLDVDIDACNPTPLPTGFDKMRFELDNFHSNNYNVSEIREFATLVLQGNTIMPNQAVTLHGNIQINAETVEEWWKIYNVYTSLDTDNISLKVTVDTRLFGFIPFSVNENFNYEQFVALLVSSQATEFQCA